MTAAVIVVLVAAAIFWGAKRLNLVGSSTASVTLREAPRGLTPVAVDEDSTQVTQGGVNLASQSVTLTDVKYGGEAKATATRSFGGGVYSLNVDATLPDPVNTDYQVWLVGDGGATPIDYMRGSKTSWSLSLRDSDKYSAYDGIWITLERTRDEIAEERVMEGSF